MPVTAPQNLAFSVIGQNSGVPSDAVGWSAYLNRDRWDDWGEYCTQFYLTVVDPEGTQHGIGQVKIGERGLKPRGALAELPEGHRKPNVPSNFEELGDDFF